MILSVGIPTYNRGYVIERTIRHLLTELSPYEEKTELVVVDNCSTDDTVSVCKKLLNEGLKFKLIQNEKNLGADGNFKRCVEKSSGEFVWLFGSDDVPISGSVRKIINKLEGDVDNVVGLSLQYEIKEALNKPSKKKIFTPELTSDISISRKDLDFDKAKMLAFTKLYLGYFPFVTCNIVRKNNFINSLNLNTVLGSGGYDFIGLFLNMLKSETSCWRFVSDPAVLCMREDIERDDSGFYGDGAWYAFEINAFLIKIFRSELGNLKSVEKILVKQFVSSYIVGDLIRLKISQAPIKRQMEVLNAASKLLGAKYLLGNLFLLSVFITPTCVLRIVKRIRNIG
jgi:glycosyltransferase involved in cell wall biosynthesis